MTNKKQALEELMAWCDRYDIELWDDGVSLGLYFGEEYFRLDCRVITSKALQKELDWMKKYEQV